MEILATIIRATKRFHIEIYLISLIAVASFKYAKRCDPNDEAAEGVLHRATHVRLSSHFLGHCILTIEPANLRLSGHMPNTLKKNADAMALFNPETDLLRLLSPIDPPSFGQE